MVIVTKLPQDNREERAYIVNKGCRNVLIRDLPCANGRDQNAATGNARP